MLSRVAFAAVLMLSSTTIQAQTSPAPTNPLQQRRSAPPAPATTAPAPEGKAVKTKPTKGVKGAGAARRTECSKEYQAAKAANTLNGQKWSKFYSACNTRLKAAGQ